VIDTPSNRAAMKDSDFSQWTKPEKIASQILEFAETGKFPEGSFLPV
jgi:hypothetical protein